METTFMTIHNLSSEANITYASESIFEVLGYEPDEVIGRSCFDYFHPNEVPFARDGYGRGVEMNKAATLYYAHIQARDGSYVSCECVFTIVHDVMVACTSIYRESPKSQRRIAETSTVRRLFTAAPQDPRYHMLEHLSAKFRAPAQPALKEPRACLMLNRFSRELPVLYATDAVKEILGVSADQILAKSFYECIADNCQQGAIESLESAKGNDSIAYLRFWYRDPRRPEDLREEEEQAMHDASQSSDSEDGGVVLETRMEIDSSSANESSSSSAAAAAQNRIGQAGGRPTESRTTSGESTDFDQNSSNAIFDRAQRTRSSAQGSAQRFAQRRSRSARASVPAAPAPIEAFEIEAFISATSDGLVVILRRAHALPAQSPRLANGFFAAPWGVNPIHPHVYQPNRERPFQHGFNAPLDPFDGPPMDDFMDAIRDVAVFAWSLTGINGNIASYGHGTPSGESQPPGGVPIWDPYAQPSNDYTPPENQAARRWAERDRQFGAQGNHYQGGYAPKDEYSQETDYQNSFAQNNNHGHPNYGNVWGRQSNDYQTRYGGRRNDYQHGYGGQDHTYVYQGPGSYANNGWEQQYGAFYPDQQGRRY